MKHHLFRPATLANNLTVLVALIGFAITATPSHADDYDPDRGAYISAIYPTPPVPPSAFTQVYRNQLVIGGVAGFTAGSHNHMVHNTYIISPRLPSGLYGAGTSYSLPDDWAPAGTGISIYHTTNTVQPGLGQYQGVYLLDAEPKSGLDGTEYDYTTSESTYFEIIMQQEGPGGELPGGGGPRG